MCRGVRGRPIPVLARMLGPTIDTGSPIVNSSSSDSGTEHKKYLVVSINDATLVFVSEKANRLRLLAIFHAKYETGSITILAF